VIGTARPQESESDTFDDLPLDDIKIDSSELNFNQNFSVKGVPMTQASDCERCHNCFSVFSSVRAMEVQTERIEEQEGDDSILVDVDESETPESVAQQISVAKECKDSRKLKVLRAMERKVLIKEVEKLRAN